MKEPTEPKDFESRILQIMDSNIRLIQYSAYAIGLMGLAFIAKSARLFTKFTSTSLVPQEFISKSVKLQGKVIQIESLQLHENPTYFTLHFQVEHIPIISLPFSRKAPQTLKIELAGVRPTLEGVKLTKLLLESNHLVWFKPYGVSCDKSVLYSSILFKRNWKQFWRKRDLALMLIKKKEAAVAPFITSEGSMQYNSHYPIYYRKLLHCEAEKT